jgi:hypothetical protein
MDRGYVDFARLHALHQAGAFFVTRAKSNLDAHRVYSAPTDHAAGVIADQTIALDGHLTRRHYPAHLRRVRFHDPKTGKTLVFRNSQAGGVVSPISHIVWVAFAFGHNPDCTGRPDMSQRRDGIVSRRQRLDRRASARDCRAAC